MNKFLVFSTILLSCHFSLLFAQNPYIREGSIGTQKVEQDTSPKKAFDFIPIEDWVGEKFIFLPKRKSEQEHGYQSFKGGRGEYGSPTYQECVGRIGTVVEVIGPEEIVVRKYKIMMKMDDNGQICKAESFAGSVGGIALIADIDSARTKWIGQTLWYTSFAIDTYNAETGEEGFIQFEKKYIPVKVIDIVAGWDEHCPARFILQTESGEEGFVDIKVGNTNIGEKFSDYDFLSFERHFLSQDPRITHKWSNQIWSAIEKAEIFNGMTQRQAQMSWGEPDEINRTISGSVKNEQWIYTPIPYISGYKYLYFENGILTSIQH